MGLLHHERKLILTKPQTPKKMTTTDQLYAAALLEKKAAKQYLRPTSLETRAVTIEVPAGKEAKWVNDVLTLVDKNPESACTFSVGDSAILKQDSLCERGDSLITIDAGTEVEITGVFGPNSKLYEIKAGDVTGLIDAYELDPVQPKSITERIKSFEDAYLWCSDNDKQAVREFEVIMGALNDCFYGDFVSPDIEAYMMLRVITTALNEGWQPTFEEGEQRWFVCADDDGDNISICRSDGAITLTESSRLLFKSDNLAEYAANQFKDIYADLSHPTRKYE